VYEYYEIVELLGKGSMGSVAMVRKVKDAIGGSARPHGRKSSSHRHAHFFAFGTKPRESEQSTVHSEDPEDRPLSQHNVPSDRFYEVTYALKTIHLDRVSDPAMIQELRNEIEILKALDHPNIVRAIETFEYHLNIGIIMELCTGGNLYSRDPYSEEQARHIVRKITSAVAYMHICGITHRGQSYYCVSATYNLVNSPFLTADTFLSQISNARTLFLNLPIQTLKSKL